MAEKSSGCKHKAGPQYLEALRTCCFQWKHPLHLNRGRFSTQQNTKVHFLQLSLNVLSILFDKCISYIFLADMEYITPQNDPGLMLELASENLKPAQNGWKVIRMFTKCGGIENPWGSLFLKFYHSVMAFLLYLGGNQVKFEDGWKLCMKICKNGPIVLTKPISLNNHRR